MGAIVAAVMTFYCGTACGIGIWKAVVIGAVSGAAGAAANGGNIFKGALIGGLSGAAFHGIGDSFGIKTGDFFGTDLNISDFISKTALHGLMGGVMSVLQGGKFGHGFASAGVTQAFSGQIDRLDINTAQSAQRVIAAAVVGGTTSVISGGKFGNGAVTGAFSRALNDEQKHGEGGAQKNSVNVKDVLARIDAASGDNFIQISNAELEAVMQLDLTNMEIVDGKSYEWHAMHRGDGSFFLKGRVLLPFQITDGPLAGYYWGADINYYYQGFQAAQFDVSRTYMNNLIAGYNLAEAAGWNAYGFRTSPNFRDLAQIYPAKRFANKGYSYYGSNSK